jgi:hypothetical protein
LVSEVVEAPVTVDPVPVEQVPDPEEAPELEVEGVPAAETQEEAATEEIEEPEPIVPVEEERRYTEAELRERQLEAARLVLEQDRRMRQAEGARRAAESRREQAEQAELRDVVEVAISRGDDAEAVTTLLNRYTDKRQGQYFERTLSDTDTALQYLTAPILGGDAPNLDERTTQIASRLSPMLQRVYDAGAQAARDTLAGETIPKADLAKYVKAERERENKAKNQDKKPLARADGDFSTNTNTLEYWERRIAREGEDGEPDMSAADWNAYKGLRAQHGLS